MTGTPGLTPERTALAWQRTTLGLLGNGGLLVLRQAQPPAAVLPTLLLAAAALVVTLVSACFGHRRNRMLLSARLPSDLAPGREVEVLGWAVVALGVGVVAVLALP